MKKYLPMLVVVLLVAGGAYALLANNDSGASQPTSQSTSKTSDDTSSNKSTVKFADPCMLLSKSALASTFGVTFKDGEAEGSGRTTSGGDTKTCKFDQANDGSVSALSNKIEFTITIESYGSEETAKSELNAVRSTANLNNKVMFIEYPAQGVGDEAFFFQGQAPIVLKSEEFMYARKGSQVFHFVVVKLSGVDHDQMRTKITDLAKSVLN